MPYQYAGFWLRTVAILIDTLILVALLTPLFLLIGASQHSTMHWTAEIILQSLIIGFTLGFWRYKNATPGKMALNLVVVDKKTGLAPSTKQYCLRYIGYFLSALPLGLGYFWIAFSKEKQGFHDMLANTLVVKKMTKPLNVKEVRPNQ